VLPQAQNDLLQKVNIFMSVQAEVNIFMSVQAEVNIFMSNECKDLLARGFYVLIKLHLMNSALFYAIYATI
jgi:hypothetical protein